jgi:predicted PurR-regulated permease PerM
MRFRLLRRRAPEADAVPGPVTETVEERVIELDQEQLRAMSAVFAAPRWLRDLGIASWLIVGVVGLIVGLVWILALTSTIVEPVLIGLVLAVVASPAVTWLKSHRVPRAAAAALVLLALVVIGVVLALLVVSGLKGQGDTISQYTTAAADTIQGWLEDMGVDESGASSAMDSVKAAVPDIIHTLVNGLAQGISGLTSLIFGLSFAVFSLFFLLKDGPQMRGWVDRHLGVPQPVAQTVTGGVITSLRRYFLGVTFVAAFNAVVVGLGALALGVPLAGTIAVVTLVTAYVPFIGAVISGAFAVLLALGAEGTDTAVIMLVIVILANGMLQNIVQPIAFGATLGLNPLVVLIVTIGSGCLFGMVGLILGAPLTSAAVHISKDLKRVRGQAQSELAAEAPSPADESGPSPAPG